MVLTFPTILDDYYDEIEQNRFTIKNEEILNDCDYIIGELAIGEWYGDYSKAEIAALKRFRTMLKNNLTVAVVIRRY